jgi:hypothetical protein
VKPTIPEDEVAILKQHPQTVSWQLRRRSRELQSPARRCLASIPITDGAVKP